MTVLVALGLAVAAITVGVSPQGGIARPGAGNVGVASLLRASAPSAPRALRVSARNGRATLHWAGPLHTNGSPVKAYLVWPFLGRTRLKAREFNSKKTSETVTGLTNHRQYTFRVAARNTVGIGPMSAPSSAVWVGSPPVAGYWRPSSSAPISWNWQLQGSVPTDTGVQVFDIDGFDNSAGTVAALHAHGTKVICYIDFGTSENFRSDFGKFPASVQGNTNGWPGERWLDIRQLSVLGPIMIARMRMCVQKGFDALEPDNIDGYSNGTGFPLTPNDQLLFNTWIANTAHSMGLSVGLKNDNGQTDQLVSHFDWALDEQCNEYSECNTESPFVNANKAVFNAEYNGDTSICSSDQSQHINGALFSLNLDGSSYQPCAGGW